ncbi:MAG: DUF5990 family protein [Ilumatobacteraceae bacterium]|nr:DUF5990 family protein [Ilumatobacteraceae bacterium]
MRRSAPCEHVSMRVSMVGTNLPGRTFCHADGTPMNNVHVGVQQRREPVSLVRADADRARWDISVDVVDRNGSVDFRGPEVQGKTGDRFVYLTWGEVGPDGSFEMFRRAKLMLNCVEPDLIESARTGGTLVADIDLTGHDGGPRCARVDPPAVSWSVVNE